MSDKIICWWSGGATSTVACKLAIDLFGKENCRAIFIDTGNEDYDTYRFKMDCENWYGIKIEEISGLGDKFDSIDDVWDHYLALNLAHGAPCSSELKRDVRVRWERENEYRYQVFGFDINEPKRAKSITMNYPKAKAIYPLLFHGLQKTDCIDMITDAGIEIPRMYALGFHNNNCAKSLCVQGGIGYFQKAREMGGEWLDKFNKMAEREHRYTDLRGEPVTICKDQSKEAKKQNNDKAQLVFLKPHPKYPHMKDISMMKGRPPKPLFECNGLGCAVNDLQPKNETENEINNQTEMSFKE